MTADSGCLELVTLKWWYIHIISNVVVVGMIGMSMIQMQQVFISGIWRILTCRDKMTPVWRLYPLTVFHFHSVFFSLKMQILERIMHAYRIYIMCSLNSVVHHYTLHNILRKPSIYLRICSCSTYKFLDIFSFSTSYIQPTGTRSCCWTVMP